MPEQTFLPFDDRCWIEIRDGNPTAMSLFERHYSATNENRHTYKFTGPGEHIVLLSPDARALFVWCKQRYIHSDQTGVNCAVFRNEGSSYGRSSELIEAAKVLAWQRWPGERLYTYVNPRKVRHKRDPGRCFLRAGFRYCGVSKRRGYLILECECPHEPL